MRTLRCQGTETLRQAVLQLRRNGTAMQERFISCAQGHRTRILLEPLCWQTLDEVAAASAQPLDAVCQAAFATFPDQPLTSALWSYALQCLRQSGRPPRDRPVT